MNKLRLSKTWLALALMALLLSTSAAIQAAPAAQGVQPQATELPPQSKIERRLEMAVTSGEQVGIFITFGEKPDLSRAYKMGWEERGKFVYETLKRTADKSQARVRAFLDARKIPYQSFFVDNSIYIQTGDSPLLNNLAALRAAQGDGPAAEAGWRAALAANPRYLPALVNLAILLTDTGRHTEAVETWRTVLRVDPGNATARRVLRELDPSGSLPERAGAHEREVED